MTKIFFSKPKETKNQISEETTLDKTKDNQIEILKKQFHDQEKKLSEIMEAYQAQQQLIKAEEVQNSFSKKIYDHEKHFCEKRSDYPQAVLFLRKRRDMDLELWGIEDPKKRKQIIDAEMAAFAQIILNADKSPAEKAYLVAKSWGYIADNNQIDNNSKDLTSSDTKDLKTELQQDKQECSAETHKQPQDKVKSLSSLAGKSSRPFSLESMAHLSDEEFDLQWKNLVSSSN